MDSLKKTGKNWKNFLISAILLLVLIFGGISFYKSWSRSKAVNDEIAQLQTNIRNLEQDNKDFQELIEYFNSDAYIEERARTDLGLKKDGEKVAVVPKTEETEATTVSKTSVSNNSELTNPQKWWNYFFSK